MEKVDLYNSRRELTGETSERNNVPEGRYRLSVHVWIRNEENNILIQQRSSDRKIFPNMWTNTGGAVSSGQTSLETAIRELKEELDVNVNTEKLELVCSYKRKTDFVDVWLLNDNLEIEDMKFQKEEVQNVKWVSPGQFDEMIKTDEAVKSSFEYYQKYINGDY
jgi:8-oxo-dGTP diphosphatase